MANLYKQEDGEKFALVMNKEEYEAVYKYFEYTGVCGRAVSAVVPYRVLLLKIGKDIRYRSKVVKP